MFFKDFFETCESLFLKGHEKKYFVFTDGESELFNNPNVCKIHQNQLGWPYDTFMRFHMFCSIEKALSDMDFLFFFNANMKFIELIGKEILADQSNDWLIGVNHPGYYKEQIKDFPYDRNPESTAFIPVGQGKYYYQGCLNGGRSEEYLEMARQLAKNIDDDKAKGIIARWHDESHLNHYFLSKNPKLLDCSYAYPESLTLPFDKKIIQLDKSKRGGHDYLRGVESSKKSTKKLSTFFEKFSKVLSKLRKI